MVKSAEKWMFEAIVTNPGHVLHHSLPREKSTGYNMRPRAHNFELRRKDTQNFLARQLYSNYYLLSQAFLGFGSGNFLLFNLFLM